MSDHKKIKKEMTDAKILSILSVFFGLIGSLAAPICGSISLYLSKKKSDIILSCIGSVLFLFWMVVIFINL